MNIESLSIFERNPKITISIILLSFSVIFIILVDILLQYSTGLGHPPLFYENPHYGFRLKPNQETIRFYGAKFKINNLGLRSQKDWDTIVDNKILFLGDSVTYGGNHLSNDALFSEIAAQNLSGYLSGNAGVPNWGVENVFGLIVTEEFLPARTYVTTFIEDDFYRGLVLARNRPWIMYESPRYALIELGYFLWHKWVVRPLRRITTTANADLDPTKIEREAKAERAVKKLREMDAVLKSKSYRHLIYISPSRDQVLGKQLKDKRVRELLAKYGVEVVYLLERLDLTVVTDEEKASWFQDGHHLTPKGHLIWGALMREDLRKSLGIL